MNFKRLRLALSCTAGLGACVQGVTHVTTPVTTFMSPDQRAETQDRNRIVLNRPGTFFRVTGRGVCEQFALDFGDGTQSAVAAANLGAGATVPHTYAGWGGPKTVTARGAQNCSGIAKTTVNVEPAVKTIALVAPLATACSPVPGFLPVRAGSVVTVRALNQPEDLINFGGLLTRGMDGSPEEALGPPFAFPFPGLKAHSLVLRIGRQIEQGGNGRSFTVRETGPLEFCINDDVQGDNRGGWGIALSVDESGAP